MTCFDVKSILLKRLRECSFAEEREGRMGKSWLQEVLIYENVEFVRFDNDGHIKILILNKKIMTLFDKFEVKKRYWFLSEDVYYWLCHLLEGLVQFALSSLLAYWSFCWVLEVLVEVCVHFYIFCQLLICLLTVSVCLFPPTVQDFNFLSLTFFKFLNSFSLLFLESFKFLFKISRQVRHLWSMSVLFITKIFFKDCNVLFESFDFVSKDLLVIARWVLRPNQFIIQFFSFSLKLSVMLGQIWDLLIGLISEFLIISLLSLSVFLTFSQFSSSSVKFIGNFLDNPSLFLCLKIVFSFGSIEFVLSWFYLSFKTIDSVVELIDSIVISFTISLESVGQVVDSSIVFLIFLRGFIRFNLKFILEGVDLSSEGKLSFIFLSLLFFLVSDKILNFLILVSEKPVLSVNLGHKCLDLMIVTWENASSFFLLKIFVFDFNIDDFCSIMILKSENFVS